MLHGGGDEILLYISQHLVITRLVLTAPITNASCIKNKKSTHSCFSYCKGMKGPIEGAWVMERLYASGVPWRMSCHHPFFKFYDTLLCTPYISFTARLFKPAKPISGGN